MADTGFKFSRLGAGGDDDHGGGDKESRTEADVRSPAVDSSTNSNSMMTMVLGDGHGARGSVKAVRRTTLLLMALVGVICLLSIVVSGLALTRVMSLQSSSPERIWTFALGESNFALHYIDGQTLEMDGFDVEIVRAVCSVAGKRCEIVTDDYTNCWKSQKGLPARGGDGLNGGWYDACAGWEQTPERRRAFAFTEPYTKPFPSAFFVPKGTANFDISNMEGKRIGFLNGYASDEHCLNRQHIMGLPLKDDQIKQYATPGDADNALRNNEIDVMFTTKYQSMNYSAPISTRSFNCTTRGSSVMTRKSSGLEEWWNPAWKTLWATRTYSVLCSTLGIRHGRFPGLSADDICLRMTT